MDDETPRDLPRSGETFGAYRVGREIGRGGMGVVYEAEHLVLHRRVALKVLPLRGGDADGRLERFLREARTAASLHHGNLVPVFDVGQSDGVPYYAMQLIEGASLDRLAHGPVPLTAAEGEGVSSAAETPAVTTVRIPDGPERFRWAAEVGRQAAEGLTHAHQRGVIHRDIKPSNLMIDARGVVWITDFGLARRLHEDVALTQSGQMVGTPRYASPEQAAAAKRPIDHRTDVYSLGATLYELITRRPAFDGATPLDVLLSILERHPVPPRQHDAAIPRDLETIVLKAMAKRPEDRYPTAAELAEDLRRFLAGEAVRARRISAVGHAARWARRNPAMAAMVLTLGLTLLTGLVGTTGFAYRIDQQRRRAVESEDKAERRAEAEAAARQEAAHNLYLARADLAATAFRDAEDDRLRRLLQAMRPRDGEADRRGWEWHFLDRRANGAARRVDLSARFGTDPRPTKVSLSRDGRRVIGQTDKKRTDDQPPEALVEVYDIDTDRLIGRRSVRMRVGKIAEAHFTVRDDGAAAAWVEGDRVFVWEVDAKRTSEFKAPGVVVIDLALSPGGDRLAVSCLLAAGGETAIVLVDPKTGQAGMTVGKEETALPMDLRFSPDGNWLAARKDLEGTRIWDVRTGRKALEVPGHGVAFDRRGRAVIASGRDLRRYDLATGRQVGAVGLEEAEADDLCELWLSEDGRRLVSSDLRTAVQLLWVEEDRPPERLLIPLPLFGPSADLAFLGSERLRSLGPNLILEEWDLRPLERQWLPTTDFTEGRSQVPFLREGQAATVSADGTRVAIASWRPNDLEPSPPPGPQGRVDVYEVETCRRLFTAPIGGSPVYVLPALDADGKTLALLGHGRADPPTSRVPLTLPALWMPTGGLPDLSRVAYQLRPYYGNWGFEVWDVASGRPLLRQELPQRGGGDPVPLAVLSPDGKYYLLGQSKSFAVWEVASGKRRPIPGDGTPLHADFVPDGRLAVFSKDGGRYWVSLWDLAGPRCLWRAEAGPDDLEAEPSRLGGIHLKGNAETLALVAGFSTPRRREPAQLVTVVRCWSPGDGAVLLRDEIAHPKTIGPLPELQRTTLTTQFHRRLVAWDVFGGRRTVDRDEVLSDRARLTLAPDGRLAFAYTRDQSVHVHLVDARGEDLGTLALPKMGTQHETLLAWFRGHRLQILHWATRGAWELHTLDGTPR